MSVTGLPEVEAGVGDILSLLGIGQNEQMAEEISRLYKEADALAVFTIKVTVALFWWASHMASATADALGYAVQIQGAMKTADKHELDTWTQFLKVKHPSEIRRVYIRTTKRIQVVKREVTKAQKVNLGPIKRELAALERWKKDTATPELKTWVTFRRLFKKEYAPALHILVRWIHRPVTLADLLALPLIGVLPRDLRKPAAAHHAAAIETALLATWTKNPQTVYDLMLDWLVAA